MLTRLRSWLHGQPEVQAPKQSRADKHDLSGNQALLRKQMEAKQEQVNAFLHSVQEAARRVQVVKNAKSSPSSGGAMDAMDSSDTGLPGFKGVSLQAGQAMMSIMPWFLQQGFIGYQNAAFIAQNWLVYKACATPVDDAIRNGYDITTADGEDLDEDALSALKLADRKFGIAGQLRDFGTKGRIFGVRIAMFLVDSKDPEYYEKPYNPDGIEPGSYKGISQIDPYWTAPILDMESAGDPTSEHFYEPTWWQIGTRRVHRSHLVIFRYADPPDVLKPLYLYGGIPLPQMIMERVYCAERTANEAPALALSKRTTVWLTNMAEAMANSAKTQENLQTWISYRDNFGIKLGDKEGDAFQQFDTPLADFDQLVMTQYGLVAAITGAPICKILGTTPGGFAATGDYEEASYHELLESMQERDFTPFVARHHEMVMRSEVIPKFQKLKGTEITIKWHELDAITHKEQADINLVKAQTDTTLIAGGVLTAEDSRARVAGDKESGFHGIGVNIEEEPIPDMDDPEAAAEAAHGGKYAAKADVEAQTESKGGK